MDENKMARAIERRRELADRNIEQRGAAARAAAGAAGDLPDGRPARRQRRLDRLSEPGAAQARPGSGWSDHVVPPSVEQARASYRPRSRRRTRRRRRRRRSVGRRHLAGRERRRQVDADQLVRLRSEIGVPSEATASDDMLRSRLRPSVSSPRASVQVRPASWDTWTLSTGLEPSGSSPRTASTTWSPLPARIGSAHHPVRRPCPSRSSGCSTSQRGRAWSRSTVSPVPTWRRPAVRPG